MITAIGQSPHQPQAEAQWTLADSWIWAHLQDLIRNVERLFQSHQYGEAGRQIYEFFWGEFADWYLEIAKLQIAEGGDRAYYTAYTLARVLDTSLRLLHPFTPFVTEALWGHVKEACQVHSSTLSPKNGWEEALIVARWPEPQSKESWEAEKVQDFSLIQDIVRTIRNWRSEKGVTPGKRISAIIVSDAYANIIKEQAKAIASLASLDFDSLQIYPSLAEKPADCVALVIGLVEVYLPLTGLVDLEAERSRLQNELKECELQIQRLEQLLNSPFAQKAPPPVVQKERDKLAAYIETKEKLSNQLISIK